MPREFPEFIDPWKAADGKRLFQGTMPLSWMRRLAPLLAPEMPGGEETSATPVEAGEPRTGAPDRRSGAPWPDATFSALFGYDEQGAVTVELEVEADLPLVCQRSMQPFSERVRRRSTLSVVESVAAQDGVPEQYEPVLADHGRIALVDLVEEELLLAVPQVPRNPEVGEVLISTDGATGAESPPIEKDVQRPFEGLAELLEKANRES
jgi:uncharacterized protein